MNNQRTILISPPSSRDCPCYAKSYFSSAKEGKLLSCYGLFFLMWMISFCILWSENRIWAQDFLDPDVAFQVKLTQASSSRTTSAQQFQVQFVIAPKYYLYKDKIQIQTVDGAEVDALPQGKTKFDANFNKNVETYHDSFSIGVRIPTSKEKSTPHNVMIKVMWQGCAEAGLCYPPNEKTFQFVWNETSKQYSELVQTTSHTKGLPFKNAESSSIINATNPTEKKNLFSINNSDVNAISLALTQEKLYYLFPFFILLGLGLAFTPCVLPMVPIISSIIVEDAASRHDDGKISRRRAFHLTLAYVLGMALVYTLLGVLAGLMGEGLSARLQHPYVLIGFAALMVVFALAMFDFYHIQIPSWIQTHLNQKSSQALNGTHLGTFIMGAISSLIIGPCVAAPLASILIFISQTQSVGVGAASLFCLAIGMGIPLIIVGVSAGSLLPRVGKWMNSIKQFFGVLMLGMALWMLNSVLPMKVQMLGWGFLLLAYATYVIKQHKKSVLAWLVGLTCAWGGGAQTIGAVMGGQDIFSPLAWMRNQQKENVHFIRIKTEAELEAYLAKVKLSNEHQGVIVDFYADWCVSCIEMEKRTLTDERVIQAMRAYTLLQVDVTHNSEDDKALLKRFQLFGPPGMIFFDKSGQEIKEKRMVGFQNAKQFLNHLESLNG